MPETITFFYIFYNQHFYAYVTENNFYNHPLYGTIMSDRLFTLYTVTVPY